MTMREAILNFPRQFEFEPKIERGPLPKFKKFAVAGMGGSHLAADLVRGLCATTDVVIHRDYGLPALSKENLKDRLIIADSFSGNTEEALDVFEKAQKARLPLVAIATGGKLKAAARERSVPYVELPDTGIQPRSALGFQLRALLTVMGEEKLLKKSRELARTLHAEDYEDEGKRLAKNTKGFVPVIYASERNRAIAYNWKIKFNETGKIPAFFNVFPELNHNEMQGFDAKKSTRNLSLNFYFLMLQDAADHPKIRARMEAVKQLYEDRKLPVEMVEVKGKNELHKMFSSLQTADWAAYHTAEGYGVEPEEVPMVEEFKKLIR